MARKPISKTLRFEVFKRDSFTCQYCGKMAPDVVLEIDHINPVKNGGGNDILNLATSCAECNRGKGAKTLSEQETLKKQQQQLKELNERREQLEMMVRWKKELNDIGEKQIDAIDEILSEKIGCTLSERGRKRMGGSIAKYGLGEVIESTYISINQYHRSETDEKKRNENQEKIVNYIHRICATRKASESNPTYRDMAYIKGILRNRRIFVNERWFAGRGKKLITAENADEVKEIAKSCRNWTDFAEETEELFGEE